MKLNKVLLVLVSFFVFSSSVKAGVCDSEHIKQLNELAKNVDVNYEYLDYSIQEEEKEKNEFIEDDDVSPIIINSYLVSVNLISDELYISNGYNDYYYSVSVNGVVSFYNNAGVLNLSIKSSIVISLGISLIFSRPFII